MFITTKKATEHLQFNPPVQVQGTSKSLDHYTKTTKHTQIHIILHLCQFFCLFVYLFFKLVLRVKHEIILFLFLFVVDSLFAIK